MGAPGSDVAIAESLLSTALDDPNALDGEQLDLTLDLLQSDRKRARITAAWILGLLAESAPDRATEILPGVARALERRESRADAERALAYFARHRPMDIEALVASIADVRLRRRCRQALWGVGPPRTIVPIVRESDDGIEHGGDPDVSDSLGARRHEWIDRPGVAHDEETVVERTRPPEDRPVEPDGVDLPFEAFEPIATAHDDDSVTIRKALYRTDDGEVGAATLASFDVTTSRTDAADFDKRVGRWASLTDHDHVLPVVAWGTDPVAWFATEHVGGAGVGGLASRVSPAAATWTLVRVADALCHAHQHGVIHGGLTPRSVVLSTIMTEPDAWAVPRVTWWGITELLDAIAPAEFALPARRAAPEYVDPDAFGAVDDATDVYLFGATAIETLTGHPPPRVTNDADRDRPPTETVDLLTEEGFSERLGVVLSKCLAPRKAERFETAQAMRAEFLDAIDGGP